MKARKAKEYIFSDLLGMESYCKNHYNEYYSKSNFSCNITQLSKGELLTSSICAPINNVHLEIFKSNQTLLYEEEANQNSVAFCWINNQGESLGSNTIISGHKMKDLSIAGFNRINKTGGNIWDIVGANTLLCCMSLKWEKMKEKIDNMNAYNAYARLEECIGIDSNSNASKQLKMLFQTHFTKGVRRSDDFYDLAIATLEEPCEKQNQLTERSETTELIEDLVKLLHEDREGLPPLTVGQISKYLNSEKESLGQACRTNFNMNILDLIKSIRLEQVKKSYLNPHVPKGLKQFTKQHNALYYGFKNWNSFQRLYYKTYQESPEETIEKASKINVLISDLFRGSRA
ncbi:MAG: AraC family transcriptional regulator [Synechococcus sp. TMED187]|nr:AraC family transcriptional regulator [Synechococcus sp. NAT40]OUW50964.1 MAG: AraC family transcriptional regulator [Synechococcus sp. TMED187]|tara:strand:+ start:1219 stop:2253 length:1035 start_codon:yes stop_codon:yes gene_type:complete